MNNIGLVNQFAFQELGRVINLAAMEKTWNNIRISVDIDCASDRYFYTGQK